MRWLLVVLVVLSGACANGELELETYAIGDTDYVRTHCAVADPILRAESPDALPQRGQTDVERVAAVLAESREELLDAFDGTRAEIAARNGQVWSNSGNGVIQIEDAVDFLIVVTISGEALCPTAPVSWNGVPIALFRDGFLD